MFCSIIIPTIGRSTLSRAVDSALAQTLTEDNFEVIVVNDSGKALPEAGWQKSERVTILHTQKRERSVARNTGAAIARGKYLNFLDDDDWLYPQALASFWELAQKNENAAWLYGSTQLVDRQDKPLIQLNHKINGNAFVQVMAGEWIPLQSSLIKDEDFFAVGGFDPQIASIEDVDLCRRILLRGEIVGMNDLTAYVGMGQEGSTTDAVLSIQQSRLAREAILNQPGVLNRMQESADTSYWYGRIARVYLTSAAWNIKRKYLITAVNRMWFGAASLLLAGSHLVRREFWQAVTRQYQSKTFAAGFEEVNLETG